MKTIRLMSAALLALVLSLSPVYAQRGGGGSRGGGSASSISRGGGSHSAGSSRASFSSPSSGRSSFSSSSSSRSSMPSSSRSSYSSPSSRSSFSTPSSRSSYGTPSSRSSFGSSESSRSSYPSTRTGSVPDQVRSRAASRAEMAGPSPDNSRKATAATVGRPSGTPPETPTTAPAKPQFASPSHPSGPLPPSHRHIHPAPYFWHPHHHCLVHCHPIYWDPIVPRPYYWPGFWGYCSNYWYDYHVTDVVVVRDYVREAYKVDLITYAMSGDYMYALVNDPDGHTYIQIYDQNDKLLAEQRVNRRYCKMEIDPENGGCWIMKKRDKDPLLFLYTEEGKLLIYEAD